jgi:hypothetical protein
MKKIILGEKKSGVYNKKLGKTLFSKLFSYILIRI